MTFCKFCNSQENLTKVPERIFKQIRCNCHKDIGYHVEEEYFICEECKSNEKDSYTNVYIDKDKLDTLQLPYSIITLYHCEDNDLEPMEFIVEGGFAEYLLDDYILFAKENELEGRFLLTIANMIGNLKVELEMHVLIFVKAANEDYTARTGHISDLDIKVWNAKRLV